MTKYNFDPELEPYLAIAPTDIDISTPQAIKECRIRFSKNTPPSKDRPYSDDVCVEDRTLSSSGSHDQTDIKVRIYRPVRQENRKLPAIYQIHGGGFILGDIEMCDLWCRQIVSDLNAIVVSIDYRLAPEHPYPAAADDCYAGLCWLFEQAEALGIDTTWVAITGQSAGACLAISTCLRARDLGGPRVCFQVLEIPVCDDRLDTVSMHEFNDTPMWNSSNAQWSWRHYLGPDHKGDTPVYAAPARATNLSDLPPTYLSTMQYDPLRDEGIEFALRLMQAGVAVELHSFPGTFHGSAIFSGASVSRRYQQEVLERLRRHLTI